MALLEEVQGGVGQGADLHRVQPWAEQSEPNASDPQHGVVLPPRHGGVEQGLVLRGGRAQGIGDAQLGDVRQELVQRWVQQPDGDGQAVHRREQATEVLALDRVEAIEGDGLLLAVRGQDGGTNDGKTIAEELVLGAAQADALGTVGPRDRGVLTGVGVGPDGEAAQVVGPGQQPRERGGRRRRNHRDCPANHRAGGAVDGDDLALADEDIADPEAGQGGVHDDVGGTAHGWRAEPPGNNGGVADQSASGGEHAGCGRDAVDVVRRGLGPDEHDLLPRRGARLGLVCGQHDAPAGRPGGRTKSGREDVELDVRGELRVQHPVEVDGPHASDRHVWVDQPLVDHLDRHAQRRRGGSFADAGLQDEQPLVLHGELEVAHVPVAVLESFHDVVELRRRGREHRGEVGQRPRVADAGHDVLALGIDEEVADWGPLAGGGVTRERHPRPRVRSGVAEDHDLHVDGSAEVVGDPLDPPVVPRPSPVPGGEHGLDGRVEVVPRVPGGGAGSGSLDHFGVGACQASHARGRQVGHLADAVDGQHGPGGVREGLIGDTEDDVPVHLQHAPQCIVGHVVADTPGEPVPGRRSEAEVEDRVHHPRHRHRGPRPDRHEQRGIGIPEAPSRALLQPLHGRADLVPQPGRRPPLRGHPGPAGSGRDGEPRRDGKAHAGHLREVGTLATQQVALGGVAVFEQLKPVHRGVLVVMPGSGRPSGRRLRPCRKRLARSAAERPGRGGTIDPGNRPRYSTR